MVDNDYSGNILTMESFTGQTTDGSGDIVVTLQNTPIADDAILVNLQGVAGAFAQFQSRSGADVTFRVYQKYDKIDTTITGSLSNMPTGVTEATSKGNTDTGGSTGNDNITGNDNTSGGINNIATSHTHGLSNIYQHDHTATTTATALSALSSTGSITLVVTYAF